LASNIDHKSFPKPSAYKAWVLSSDNYQNRSLSSSYQALKTSHKLVLNKFMLNLFAKGKCRIIYVGICGWFRCPLTPTLSPTFSVRLAQMHLNSQLEHKKRFVWVATDVLSFGLLVPNTTAKYRKQSNRRFLGHKSATNWKATPASLGQAKNKNEDQVIGSQAK